MVMIVRRIVAMVMVVMDEALIVRVINELSRVKN